MKYFLIAGERSGDLHGSNLIKEIRALDPLADFYGMGGELMQESGMKLFLHYRVISFMGFAEVLFNLRKIAETSKAVKNEVKTWKPDVIILIDFAGFNLRIANFAKTNGFKVAYYISPKIWAWKQNRALKVKKWVDRMFVIMPFEKEFYSRFDYHVEYVGNPVLDSVTSFSPDPGVITQLKQKKQIVALLPGSRRQEVEVMAERVLPLSAKLPDFAFVVAGVSNLDRSLYKDFEEAGITVIFDSAYDLLSVSYAAIVTSGTATLETALFKVPQVVVYKASSLTYLIAKNLIKVPFISLVNLIAGKEVVKELIQNKYSPEILEKELMVLLDQKARERMLKDYQELTDKLGEVGASRKAAEGIVKFVNK